VFKKLKGIHTLPDAIRHAKRLCRCTRNSFDGVSYFDERLVGEAGEGDWVRLTWLEIDRGRSRLYPAVSEGAG
jgi:hypothetical protein